MNEQFPWDDNPNEVDERAEVEATLRDEALREAFEDGWSQGYKQGFEEGRDAGWRA